MCVSYVHAWCLRGQKKAGEPGTRATSGCKLPCDEPNQIQVLSKNSKGPEH